MKKIISLGLGVLALGMSTQAAFAQREAPTRQDRRQQRQQETANMTPEQRAQFMQQRFQERLKNATPEQRARMEQRMQQMQEQARAQGIDPNDPAAMMQLMQRGGRGGNGGNAGGRGGGAPLDPAAREAQRRQMMMSAGIYDKATQDDILAFIVAEEQARQPLLQLARAAATALTPATRFNGTPVVQADGVTPVAPTPESEAAVASAFEAYTTALEADKVRHQKALDSLDASISYKNNPRLKAFLSLVGIIDNEALALGGAPAIFNSGPAGRGNRARPARTTNANATPAAPEAAPEAVQ
jgi:hypothetical protein